MIDKYNSPNNKVIRSQKGNGLWDWIKKEQYLSCVQLLFNKASSKEFLDTYDNWKKIFIDIHGNLNSQRKVDISKLSSFYKLKISNFDEFFKLLFCLETYYALVLRVLAAQAFCGRDMLSIDCFNDSFFENNGVTNYTCPAYYNWFLKIPGIDSYFITIDKEIRSIADSKGDNFISGIFESVFPKEVRHGLGEFYTPYWLADQAIDTLTKDDPDACHKTYIDPTCGSGVFLVALINKFDTLSSGKIFNSVFGIDINPLTVLAAKTNYLLLYIKRFDVKQSAPVTIPIYYSDIIHGGKPIPEYISVNNSRYDTVPSIQYDYIVGNPPWVNWEYLPEVYKQKYSFLWQYYGLFEKKGLNSNFIKEDISVLFTYIAIDKYLKIGGGIAFLLKETLFKSIMQGEGFRKFVIKPSKCPIEVFRVDDLSSINPFKGAVTRTALFYAIKGQYTNYPVDYYMWHTKKQLLEKQISVNDCFELTLLKARPSEKNVLNSGWITESETKLSQSDVILGNNQYKARTGTFTGGANGIFWLNILSSTEHTVTVQNNVSRAKNKVKVITKEIEKDLVYPFLTGNELEFWGYSYSKYIICPHNSNTKMCPISKNELHLLPKSEAYFNDFKKELEERRGFTSFDEEIHKKYYYTLQRIGDYSFAPFKVCWRYISKSFTPAVVEYANDIVLGNKNIICNEKIISIGLNDQREAYYVCGLISSTLYRETIESFMVGTQITPSIINKLNIPVFEKTNPIHCDISEMCFRGHKEIDRKSYYISKIDILVKQLLGI
ncbi:MAG: N-6 DNA methylase [Bacteroidales bacterium]|nr:N-6 DNA methylase [Bacteroidales bacterium]